MAEVNAALKSAYADGFYGRPVATNLYGAYLNQMWKADGTIFLTPSHNWQGVAILCDALNHVNKAPHLMVSLSECFRWMTAYLRWQFKYGYMNHEQDSDIYKRHHHGFVRGFKALALKFGDPILAALCDKWLLVAVTHAAVSRSRVPVLLFSDAERKPKPAPAVYIATIPSKIYSNALPGQREESTQNDGEISVDESSEEGFLREALLGELDPKGYGAVLRSRGYDYSFGLTLAAKADLFAVTKRDVTALRAAIERIADVPCALECFIEWTDGGINGWAPELPGGSTLGKGVHIIYEPSGKQVILLSGDGGRDTGADDTDVGPSVAVVNESTRTVYIKRTDTGKTSTPVSLAGANRVALVTWNLRGHEVLEPKVVFTNAGAGPVTVTLPSTKVGKPSWIERMGL